MMYIHPAVQVCAALLGLYVLYLGAGRFRSLHLGSQALFKRRRHIVMGQFVLYAWLAGALFGLLLVRWAWHGWLVTGTHGHIGLAALPLLLFGIASGLYMAKRPKKRIALPLAHGLSNLAMTALGVVQFFTGREVIEVFLQGV